MANPFAVELSLWMGDRGYGHFIYFSVCLSGTIALDVMNSPTNSASEAEDITTLLIWARDSTGQFLWGIGSLSEAEYVRPCTAAGASFIEVCYVGVCG